MTEDRIKYRVGPYNGGYPVYLEEPSHPIATFISERHAIQYAEYATAQLWKHDTSDTHEWDAPVTEEQK